MDDCGLASVNTGLFVDHFPWSDIIWALLHAAGVVSWWHHDGDGKLTCVNATTGAKIWVLFVPREDLTADELADVLVTLAKNKVTIPEDKHGKLISVLLLPGDTL